MPVTNFLVLFSPTVSRVLITATVLGILAGSFGVLVVLKKQALVGDTLAHSALPGVVLTFLLFSEKRLEFLLIGAAISAVIAMGIFGFVRKYSKIKNDAVLALVLAGLFGLGIAIYEYVQRQSGAGSAGLDTFIYGQTATILESDMYMIIGASAVIYLIIALFWKELKLSIFNPEYFDTLGFKSNVMDVLFSVLIVLVVVLGIQMVGVVLISAMLIAPAVAARQWSNRLSLNFIIAGAIGGVAGFFGTLIGDRKGWPAGPTIIIVLSCLVLLSLFFAPKRGILAKVIQDWKYKVALRRHKPLINFYQAEIAEFAPKDKATYLKQGLIAETGKTVMLTEAGLAKVRVLLGGEK